MSLTMEDIKGVVREAGQLALLYSGKVHKGLKADQSVVTEADNAIESFLRLSLTRLAPTYGYLGEETEENKLPADGETRYWVVDALDGSRAFAAGIPLWMPAICLMDGNHATAGAAFNPITGELFWADTEGPAWCGDRPLRPDYSVEMKPNTFIFGPTNHHRSFHIDFPGRVYCLAPRSTNFACSPKARSKVSFLTP